MDSVDNDSKPILVIFQLDCTVAQYDEVWGQLRSIGICNEHLFAHIGAEDGNQMVMVDVWPSAETEKVFRDHVLPLIEATGAKISWNTYPVRNMVASQIAFSHGLVLI